MARQPTGFTPAPTETRFADTVFDTPMVNVPDFDPVDVLPERAADRLRKLRQRAADLHLLMPRFDQVQDVSIERSKVAHELKRLGDAASDGGFGLKPEDVRVATAQKRLDKLTAEAARLSQMREARSAAWQTVSRTLRAVEDWLRGKPSGTVEDFDGPAPTLNGKDDLLSALEKIRRRGRELQADLHRIQSAPYPASFAKQRMREQVEILAQHGAPSVARLIEHADGKFEFPLEMLKAQIHNVPQAPAAIGYAEIVDPVAVVAWLFKDQLVARLDAEIFQEADDKAALSPDDRQRKEAVVLADLLSVEHAESFLVWRGQNEMLPVEHRADADPRAILGVVTLVAAVTPGNGRETSWMHGTTVTGR